MLPDQLSDLLKIVWKFSAGKTLVTTAGIPVEIISPGEYDPVKDLYGSGRVRIGDTILSGDIAIGSCEDSMPGRFCDCVMQVVPGLFPMILKDSGEPLPQLVYDAGADCVREYGDIISNRSSYGCGPYISSLDEHTRLSIFTRLLADRLRRKCGEILEYHEDCQLNWNETMYTTLLVSLNGGSSQLKKAYKELASRVKYIYISRERDDIRMVESMLIGASGLLEQYEDDDYTRDLKKNFDYLRRKHSIVPMNARQWVAGSVNPQNHPVLRLAQMAVFLTTREFIFDQLLTCRAVEDIQSLFRTGASDYWDTHFTPANRTSRQKKSIGHFKANLLGINLVVPMKFAYGTYMNEERVKEEAVELLEKIKPEQNRYLKGWKQQGVRMESAFDSQALMQLNNEYCLKGRCWLCPVGKSRVGSIHRQLGASRYLGI